MTLHLLDLLQRVEVVVASPHLSDQMEDLEEAVEVQ
jgi:hypothetical protein